MRNLFLRAGGMFLVALSVTCGPAEAVVPRVIDASWVTGDTVTKTKRSELRLSLRLYGSPREALNADVWVAIPAGVQSRSGASTLRRGKDDLKVPIELERKDKSHTLVRARFRLTSGESELILPIRRVDLTSGLKESNGRRVSALVRVSDDKRNMRGVDTAAAVLAFSKRRMRVTDAGSVVRHQMSGIGAMSRQSLKDLEERISTRLDELADPKPELREHLGGGSGAELALRPTHLVNGRLIYRDSRWMGTTRATGPQVAGDVDTMPYHGASFVSYTVFDLNAPTGTDRVLSRGITDFNGRFSFGFAYNPLSDNDESADIVVKFGFFNEQFQVVDRDLNPYEFTTSPITGVTPGRTSIGTFVVPEGDHILEIHDIEGANLVHQSLVEGFLFYSAAYDKPIGVLQALYPSTRSAASSARIFINREDARATIHVLHEMGHAVNALLWDLLAPVNREDINYGSDGHSWDSEEHAHLAFLEGFAEYFTLAALDRIGEDSIEFNMPYFRNILKRDFEHREPNPLGINNEGNIASLLADLDDDLVDTACTHPSAGNFEDDVDLPRRAIFLALDRIRDRTVMAVDGVDLFDYLRSLESVLEKPGVFPGGVDDLLRVEKNNWVFRTESVGDKFCLRQ